MKVEYGKHFKVKVSRYTDEDFEIEVIDGKIEIGN